MSRICFVTTELSPFTSGGIGVLIANQLKHYQDPRNQFTVLFAGSASIQDAAFSAAFPMLSS